MSSGLAQLGPVGEAELSSIVEAVWACALATAETPVPAPAGAPAPAVAGASRWWRADVTIRGRWDGQVSVECTQAAAVAAASYMLAVSPDLVDEADVRDALGELANVVGGGVKSLLPECNQLSLPVVHPQAVASRRGAGRGCRLALTWHGEPLVVTVARADVEGT